MSRRLVLAALLAAVLAAGLGLGRAARVPDETLFEILARTTPLPAPRGERLPLLVWPAHLAEVEDGPATEALVRALEARGLAAIALWRPDDPAALEAALRLARVQARVGQPVAASATALTYGFFDGDPATAHVDDDGRPFFDRSFPTRRKMGCPFAIDGRLPVLRRRIETYVRAYRAAGLPLDFVYADWEVDGPLEWNGAWESAKRCRRCRRRVPDLDDFASFQAAIRTKRAELERRMLAEPVLEAYPGALVGNYGVYPHDGYRYWFDYFESFVEGAPHRADGRAVYRRWFDEFPLTGFTFAMPVVYPWARIFRWYEDLPVEYRWFYNMLLVGSNAGRSTPPEVPLVSFVHRGVVDPPAPPPPGLAPLGEERYRDLLWHLLLRGHDALFVWSPPEGAVEESVLAHEVYRASHPYREFLARGTPVVFDVPREPGPVVSALRLGDRVLVRRTDFDERTEPVPIAVDGRTLAVPRTDGRSLVLALP